MSAATDAPAGAAPGPAVPTEVGPSGPLALGDAPWERHPADAARLVAAVLGLAAAVGLFWAAPGGVAGVSRDLVRLAARLPDVVQDGLVGLVQVVAAVAPVVLVVDLLRRRLLPLLGALVAAGGAAALAATLLQGWLDTTAPVVVDEGLGPVSWLTGSAFPSPAYLAGLAAVTTVLVPSLPRAWRRAAWLALLLLAVLRILTAVAVPLQVGTTLLIGVTVGSAVLVATGAPRRRTRRVDVAVALGAVGHPVRSVGDGDLSRDAVVLADGTAGTVRVVDRDDRDADLLFRALRALRRRGVEGDRPTWSPTRVAHHEALVTLLAARAGVPVPDVVDVATTDSGAGVLLTRADASVPLADLDLDEVTEDLLGEVWDAVVTLHRERIAHGRLHTGHVRIRPAGDGPRVVLADLSRATTGADDARLVLDVAELLTSLAVRVGPERAVATAGAVDPVRLGATLPLLQPLALSATTRRAVKGAGRDDGPDVLAELREQVQAATDVEAYELAGLERISVGRAVSLVGTAVLLYVFLAFASNWSAIAEALGEADWTLLPLVLAMAAVVYPTGALSLMGAVTTRLPLGQTTEVMLGQAFLNRFTPANAGGMALRARYLQRNGVELDVAAASIGITSAASGVVQVVLVVGFLLWSGQSGGLGVELPDVNVVAIALLALLAVGGIVWFTPLRRRLFDSRIAVSATRVFHEIRDLAKDPTKLALLFGGATLGKLATIVAFVASARAFGVDLSFAELGALYLTANTVASAAPTPGGVGAVEAALVAVLTGAGVPSAEALSITLVFRLATFWMPVPPSYLALQHLRRADVV